LDRAARPARPLAPADLADTLLSSDTRGAWFALRGALAVGATYMDVATDLVGPALAEVGARWADRGVTVAQEHLATANARMLFGHVFSGADGAHVDARSALDALG